MPIVRPRLYNLSDALPDLTAYLQAVALDGLVVRTVFLSPPLREHNANLGQEVVRLSEQLIALPSRNSWEPLSGVESHP
ncbi:MAG: hypothetical protein ABR507_09105 [Actinomycetota bacterium]